MLVEPLLNRNLDFDSMTVIEMPIADIVEPKYVQQALDELG